MRSAIIFSGKILFLTVILCGGSFSLSASHNRAGEITYQRIAPFTAGVGSQTVQVYNYSITVVKYTDHGSGVADRCVDTVYFGDGSKGVALRVNGTSTCGCQGPCGELIVNTPNYVVKKNVYTVTHTYAGPGQYVIRSWDPNRNQGIMNIPNSVNQPFYIESMLIINSTGRWEDASPVFTHPPVDLAAPGVCFVHNGGAYDPDGDSLSFELTVPRGTGAATVSGYFFPPGNFSISPVTGELVWCTPGQMGEWAIAYVVKQWRKETCDGSYQLRGYVVRDMQTIVNTAAGSLTTSVQGAADTCVAAGQPFTATISAQLSSGSITAKIEAFGSPFSPQIVPQPVLSASALSTGQSAVVSWSTSCAAVSGQPHRLMVVSLPNTQQSAVSIYNSFVIHVLPPSPVIDTMIVDSNKVTLNWHGSCADEYRVYRKIGSAGISAPPCTPGNPSGSGFSMIGAVSGTVNTFTDNDLWTIPNGSQGNYLVLAVKNCEYSLANNVVSRNLIVGIKEDRLSAHVVGIYPNPFTQSVSIESKLPGVLDNAAIRIFSVDGKEVLTHRHAIGQRVDLQTNSLAPGFYFVEIAAPGGNIRKKVLKE